MPEATISGYAPGALGRIVELHARHYARHWNFGPAFEATVAAGLAEFLPRLDPGRDGLWTLQRNGTVMGSIAIDGAKSDTAGAHLRWFIIHEDMQGQGHGGRLLRTALDFCAACRHPRVFLWTFQGLDPARRLYERHGFRLAEQRHGQQWGTPVPEQRFMLDLDERHVASSRWRLRL